ncbi:hypothetical protein BGX28_003349 [Mortierella sp. GBA30]|nr:hypothetical protein BGX28_003349 [Mortierella sp. GBA30]
MQPKAIIAFLACLCLSIRADAFWNFGRIIRTTANTLEGVENLIHGTFGAFTAEELGFEEDADFKAKLIGVNALCPEIGAADRLTLNQVIGLVCSSLMTSFPKGYKSQRLSSVVMNGESQLDHMTVRGAEPEYLFAKGQCMHRSPLVMTKSRFPSRIAAIFFQVRL